jgi:opacity protein-like surface antigen
MTTCVKSALVAATALVVASSSAIAQPAPVPVGVHNVLLVHGAFADGSGWRGVYDILTHRGYHVGLVQIPLTSLRDDVAAVDRVLARQDGPATRLFNPNTPAGTPRRTSATSGNPT